MSQSLESSVKQTLEKKNDGDILIFQILFNLLGSGVCNPTQCSITRGTRHVVFINMYKLIYLFVRSESV